MKIIIAVDDDNGLLFNHRRQSKDSEMRKEIISICKNKTLWMNDYTSKQFDQIPENVKVSDTFLEDAGKDDYCFVEDREILPYAEKTDTLILFHWNRRYPSDLKLDFIPTEHQMILLDTREFQGSSHDKITMEVWGKDVI